MGLIPNMVFGKTEGAAYDTNDGVDAVGRGGDCLVGEMPVDEGGRSEDREGSTEEGCRGGEDCGFGDRIGTGDEAIGGMAALKLVEGLLDFRGAGTGVC
jgi:hypothetical protein